MDNLDLDSIKSFVDTLWVIDCAILVFIMQAGFMCMETGLSRHKNSINVALKNAADFGLSVVVFWIFGFGLMFGTSYNGFFGTDLFFFKTEKAEYMTYFVFQAMFVATAATIISGAVAERMKFNGYLIITVIATGIIYPIVGHWAWSSIYLNNMNDAVTQLLAVTGQVKTIGWLTELGFVDFAGSTIVHSVGGWAAVVGCLILGPRAGKYNKDGKISPIAGANMPLACLGTFILWFGWFGFNGGSQLALGSALDAVAISIVVVNTNLAACGGVVAAIILSQFMYKKIDLSIALNGAIAGLVAITAGPDLSNHFVSMIIGAIGGVLCTIAIPMLDKMKIDDVVGAISAHLVAGIWGTLAVGIFGGGDFIVQVIGIVAAGVLVVPLSAIGFYILKATTGLRVDEETEAVGLDKAELTTVAYPEFN